MVVVGGRLVDARGDGGGVVETIENAALFVAGSGDASGKDEEGIVSVD